MNLQLEIFSDRRWSYANAGSRRPLIKEIHLHCEGSLPDRDIKVVPRVTVDFPLPEAVAEQWVAPVPRTIESRGESAGSTISWDRIDLRLNYAVLGRLLEKVLGHVLVEIVDVETDQVLVSTTQNLELLAPNEFRQELNYFEVIAAFVMPSDPFVSEILRTTRVLLGERTESSSTEGYQSDGFSNPSERTWFPEDQRSFKIAEAIYEAMSAYGYDYSNPQGYFEMGAQRVRTPSQIKSENCATCLDSAVLMAACFAQGGLEPVVFMIKGHAFAGYFTGKPVPLGEQTLVGWDAIRFWRTFLKRERKAQLLPSRDHALIQQLLREGHIQPVETTTTTRSSPQNFREASQSQNGFSITDDAKLESIVVVRLARDEGITPPPMIGEGGAVAKTDEPVFEFAPISDVDLEAELDLELDEARLSPEERSIPPRVRQWMASLLDLGSRNPLLKIKTKQVMEFDLPSSYLGVIDDALHRPGQKIEIAKFSGLPSQWVHQGVSDRDFEDWLKDVVRLVFPSYKEMNRIQAQVESELKRRKDADPQITAIPEGELLKQLRDSLLASKDTELGRAAKKIADKASEALLMSGNNSLYLALGVVDWTETTAFRGAAKPVAWSAPLYLYPVILEGGKGGPWTIHLDPNGEVTPNYCLHEKLKRPPYNLDLQELVSPDTDDAGIDFDKMLGQVRQRLSNAKLDHIAVQPRAVLGVFDYSTFRLWKDLKDDWKKMAKISPVFKHLAYTPNQTYAGNPEIPAEQLEPLLPIDADDSQKAAIQMALDGQSFKLEGPPGTGKSQTITNLLASCIAHNKKVLFIAEKQTALNAVKERLEKVGLGVFSLNLHAKGDSDAKIRKTIESALDSAKNANVSGVDEAWDDLSFRLAAELRFLEEYRKALHECESEALSVWNANEELLQIEDKLSIFTRERTLGLSVQTDRVEVPFTFLQDYSLQLRMLRDALVDFEHAIELVGDISSHPWRWVGALDVQSLDLAHLRQLVEALHSSVLKLNSSHANQDLENLDTPLIQTVNALVGLEKANLLAPAQFLLGLSNGNADLLSSIVNHKNQVQLFLAECESLRQDLQGPSRFVSPAILLRGDLDRLRAAASSASRHVVDESLLDMRRAWESIADQVSASNSPAPFVPVADHSFESATKWLEEFDSVTSSSKLNDVVSRLKALQNRIVEFDSSISGEFVLRTDLASIEFRISEAQSAGLLSRGRKASVLREQLGTQILTTDNQLMIHAASQMVSLAREVRVVINELEELAPQLPLEDFRPWVREDIDGIHVQVQNLLVSEATRLDFLQGWTGTESDYASALRLAIAVSPLIKEVTAGCREILPDFDATKLRLWNTDDFEIFRDEVLKSEAQKLFETLGTDAISRDPVAVIDATSLVLDLETRLSQLGSSFREVVFPGATITLNIWDSADFDQLTAACGDLLSVLNIVTSATAVELVRLFDSTRQPRRADLIADFGLALSNLEVYLSISPVQESGVSNEMRFSNWVSVAPKLVDDAGPNNSFLQFHRLQSLRLAEASISDLGLGESLPVLLRREMDPEQFLLIVRRSVVAKLLRIQMEAADLDRFDHTAHARRIESYAKKLDEARELLKERIPSLVVKRSLERALPSGKQPGAVSSLLRGLKPKRGNKTPIRDLAAEYGNVLAEALPCFLMSPDSVAALLPVGAIDFDLVVFDEASQIRTAHAVGALGRARAAVVVGDTRQMPPSTTFSANGGAFVAADAPEEELDSGEDEDAIFAVAARDAESVLSEFEESEMPQRQLLCHYRSKDEVLIAFSNTFIYREPMLTFPSPKGMQSDALRFVFVEDGNFERDKSAPPYQFGDSEKIPSIRTNLREAEEIVTWLIERLNDPKRRARRAEDLRTKDPKGVESIIVVTFNIPQMHLVRELFRSKAPELFDLATTPTQLEESGVEIAPQVKIRNLENVQGDEAETVVFSVAFSKDAKGKVPLRFGPVSQIGGERRLNVAVTRAQREMIVFASFRPDDLSSGSANLSEEVKLIQSFLSLAEKGPNSVGDVGIGVQRSRHIDSVARELGVLGFDVATQLGLSSLRVDIALKRKNSPTWEIAVLVDDTGWADRGSGFQREVLPVQQLKTMGWKRVCRIWLPSWMNSRQEILEIFKDLLSADLDVQANISTETSIAGALGSELDNLETNAVMGAEPVSTDAPAITAEPAQRDPGDSAPGSDFELFESFGGDPRGDVSVLDSLPDDPVSQRQVSAAIEAILEVESPIQIDRLLRLLGGLFGLLKIKQGRKESLLKSVPRDLIQNDSLGQFVWSSPNEWESWDRFRLGTTNSSRIAAEICSIEYRNALVDFLRRQRVLSHEDAVRELATAFGFSRVGPNVRAAIEQSIVEALTKGIIEQSGDSYSLPNL